MASNSETSENVSGLRSAGPSGVAYDSQLKCNICYKIFSKIPHRKRHENNVHGVPPDYKNTSIKCNKCSVTFPFLRLYREHLHQVHDVVVGKVNQEFNSKEGKILGIIPDYFPYHGE